MNKKILGVFFSLLVFAIFVLPISVVLAPKPMAILFFGYPTTGDTQAEVYDGGESDNRFMIWSDLTWTFCWDYISIEVVPGVFMPVSTDDLAVGVYDGRWVMHKFVPSGIPGVPGSFTSINTWGRHTVEVVDWEGETGEFVLQGVGGRWNIVSGTVGEMKLHGGGTVEQVQGTPLWKYEGTVQLTP
jgi:hypothetical protein